MNYQLKDQGFRKLGKNTKIRTFRYEWTRDCPILPYARIDRKDPRYHFYDFCLPIIGGFGASVFHSHDQYPLQETETSSRKLIMVRSRFNKRPRIVVDEIRNGNEHIVAK